jgi:hypothetical protein
VVVKQITNSDELGEGTVLLTQAIPGDAIAAMFAIDNNIHKKASINKKHEVTCCLGLLCCLQHVRKMFGTRDQFEVANVGNWAYPHKPMTAKEEVPQTVRVQGRIQVTQYASSC